MPAADQKNHLWMGVIVAFVLGIAVVVVAARAPEIVPKETKALAENAAEAKKPKKSTAPDSLTEKREQGDGVVIKPAEEIDPEFHKEPPAEGTMKVIIPPGTPGGDQSIEPK